VFKKAAAKPVGPPAKELFGAAKTPAPLHARSIGFYAKGCLAGATALPIDGIAWQAMRLSRNRNWGQDGEVPEDTPPLRHQRDALSGDLLGLHTCLGHAEHLDRARAGRQQADGHIHARGLARAVAADETEHTAFASRERYALQHMAISVVGMDADE